MIHGNVRQVKKLRSLGVAIIEVEIPIEHYKAAVNRVDDEDVLLDTRQNMNVGEIPYGMIEREIGRSSDPDKGAHSDGDKNGS